MTQDVSKTIWQINGTTLQGNIGRLAATFDLTQPEHGISIIRHNGQRLPDCLPLQVSPGPATTTGNQAIDGNAIDAQAIEPPAMIDSYIRGKDVVVTYARGAKPSVQTTLCWRDFQIASDVLGVELIASVQTSLLDGDPTLSMRSDCRGIAHWIRDGESTPITDDVWSLPRSGGDIAEGFILFRLEEGISYTEMVDRSDFNGVSLTKSIEGTSRLAYQMFTDGLEKGVLRRGRVRGFFLPSDDDVAAAWAVYQQFIEEPPPLTT